MTAKAALCIALLKGEVVSIMTGFEDFSITNIPREIGRQIERLPSIGKRKQDNFGFGVIVSRIEKSGVSRYGVQTKWIEYRLNRAEYNSEGIERMKLYVREELKNHPPPKTTEQVKYFKQLQMVLK